jgi:uncharacterized membrane protein YraQ (UPF0718 family)
MNTKIKRYRGFIITAVAIGIFALIDHQVGMKAINIAVYQFGQMLLVIPPVFLLLGILDVWVPRETMIKYMGEDSGLRGIILSILIGAAAAGPLYGAFPVAAVFVKKGVKFSNILIFIGAWSTVKIPMFLFEMTALGAKFAITRLLVDIPGIIIIAYILSKMISKQDVEKIYENIRNIS